MKLRSVVAAISLGLAAGGSFADGVLGPLAPSASFSNTVTGPFTDIWTFDLGTPSVVAASITNVEVSFNSVSVGGIQGFSAWLNGVQLFGPTSSVSQNGVTVTTQVVAGGTTLPAGIYQLKVSGTGISGANASYGGNIVATPVPEPGSHAMLLAGLGVLGFIAARRQRAV